MRAFRITAPGRTELVETAVPRPGLGEVQLRVLANGLCHSDLMIRSLPVSLPGVEPPVTMGHEVAGEVTELGPGVTGWAVGGRAVAYVMRGCGRCRPCLAGADNWCRRGYQGLGTHFDGGLAEYVVMPTRHLVPIGDLDPVLAAPLADAGLTSYHAVERLRAHLGPDGVALVIGVGGLGHLAVQILAATSATRIVAVDVAEEKLALARALGAHETVLAGEHTADAIRATTDPEGVTAVLDFVGSDVTLSLAAAVTKRGAAIAVPGQGGGSLRFTSAIDGPLSREVSLIQTSAGSMDELRAVVRLGRRGLIRAETAEFALESTAEAMEMLDAGKVVGRAVIVPGAP